MEAIYKEKSWYYCIHDPNSTEEQQIYRSEAKVVWIFPILLFPLLHLRNSALCIFLLKALLCINASFHRYQICLSVKLLTATILRMIRMYKLIVIYYLFHQEYIEQRWEMMWKLFFYYKMFIFSHWNRNMVCTSESKWIRKDLVYYGRINALCWFISCI